jgi:hypothetical protein
LAGGAEKANDHDPDQSEDGGVKPNPVEAKPKAGEPKDSDTGFSTFFSHPASIKTQRIIWVPDDELGLGKGEVKDMKNQELEASAEKVDIVEVDKDNKVEIRTVVKMDKKGKMKIEAVMVDM